MHELVGAWVSIKTNIPTYLWFCTFEKPKRPDTNDLTNEQIVDLKSEFKAKKEERREQMLKCACCADMSVEDILTAKEDRQQGDGSLLLEKVALGSLKVGGLELVVCLVLLDSVEGLVLSRAVPAAAMTRILKRFWLKSAQVSGTRMDAMACLWNLIALALTR